MMFVQQSNDKRSGAKNKPQYRKKLLLGHIEIVGLLYQLDSKQNISKVYVV
jgi:hypothetical protein